jgi:hypothetical protein
MLVLTLETELLLVSAGKRLYLYAHAHGLTTSRIFGMIFLLWLSLVLLLLLGAILRKMKRVYFFGAFFVITALSFISFNIFSMDGLIATKYPPTINKEVDYTYILSLSPEAAQAYPPFMQFAKKEWGELSAKTLPTEDENRRREELRPELWRLQRIVFYLDRKYTTDSKKYIHIYDTETEKRLDKEFSASLKTWQAFNSSEYTAYLLIRENRSLFDQIPAMLTNISEREKVWIEESARRNPNPPVQ